MTVGTVTVKLTRDLYARLDTLAKQERTDVLELLGRLVAAATVSGPKVGHPRWRFSASLPGPPIWA